MLQALVHIHGTELGRLARAEIYIDDTPGISITQLRAKARRLKQKHGIDMIVVDYLQLMTGGGRFESRQQEISAISRGLKSVARELSVHKRPRVVRIVDSLPRNAMGKVLKKELTQWL